MNTSKKKVLLGPMFNDPAESVSAVNRAFVSGLSERYHFIYSQINAKRGHTHVTVRPLRNCWRTCLQMIRWAWSILRHRPQIAHYAISSGWAMEKGLLFLMLARWSGAATFGHLHSGGFLDHWTHLPDWRRKPALRQLQKLDGFIVLSKWWHTQITEIVGIPKDMIWVVNNPIDPDFERKALSFPIQREQIQILSMGTMGRDKGVYELIESCGILKRTGCHYLLNLAGPEREPCITAAVIHKIDNESCGHCIYLAGPVFGDDKLKLYRESTIFVLPSYYENFPLVVLEAAAAGHAIITTPVGAIPEFFEHGVSAIFVPPRDSLQLAAALKDLLEDPQKIKRLGEGARKVFRTLLERDKIFESLANVYSGRPKPRPTCQTSLKQPATSK